jgi:3-hydroxyisobutyrate dehydrogenase-like beta-hydroxyacid dehydrogenase
MSANSTVVGLLHPGEMGAAVGGCLTGAGHRVLWASEGRGADTAARAQAAGLTDVRTARSVVADAEVILSPPHAALDVAWVVHGFTGLYVDANAIAPGTAREVAQLITGSGGRYVDGGIIGGPPVAAGAARLYLSGADAPRIQELFAGTALETRVASGSDSAASAIKMAYASWTKGSSALLLTARALAPAEGVEEALLAEWALSQPQLPGQLTRAARSAVSKGWRWVGEMEEIAASMTAAGLPDGFHQAAAEVYRRSPRLPADQAGGAATQATEAVLAALTGISPGEEAARRP